MRLLDSGKSPGATRGGMRGNAAERLMGLAQQCVLGSTPCRHARICLAGLRNAGATRLLGHPLELGHDFLEQTLPKLTAEFNAGRAEPIPYLAALVCANAADLALHDAYGNLPSCDVYQTYGREHCKRSGCISYARR